MKNVRLWMVMICVFIFPCIIVLFFGSDTEESTQVYDSSFFVLVEGEQVDSERFLIWALAGYVEPSANAETLKAMAVILRTNMRKRFAGRTKISAEELDFTYYKEDELEKIWGKEVFVENYRKLEKAVTETKKAVILDDNGNYIDALFHRVSVGTTREGAYLGDGYEYLCAVKSEEDINAQGYMQIIIYEEETFRRLLENYFGMTFEKGIKPFAQEVVLKNEDGGYVEKVTICGEEFNVDEFAKAIKLQSPAFYFEEYGAKIRFYVSGVGHGFGLSIYGADTLAGEGYGFKDILKYYYANIIIKYE